MQKRETSTANYGEIMEEGKQPVDGLTGRPLVMVMQISF